MSSDRRVEIASLPKALTAVFDFLNIIGYYIKVNHEIEEVSLYSDSESFAKDIERSNLLHRIIQHHDNNLRS